MVISEGYIRPLLEKLKTYVKNPYLPNEILFILASILMLIIVFVELFEWEKWFPGLDTLLSSNKKNVKVKYGYDENDGPTVWKHLFEDALGKKQSPINLITSKTILCEYKTGLNWSLSYGCSPDTVRLLNDGHSVVLHAKFENCINPNISGGPLVGKYFLHSIRFRWGPCDDEGSEHTIDFQRFALELQATHIKEVDSKNLDQPNNLNCRFCEVVVVSYLFQVTPEDNPFLEPVISNLKKITTPKSYLYCAPFPLCWLMPPFASDFYTYYGSLTYPPCTEGIIWIIQPEPLAISTRQVRKFRKLRSYNGVLASNTRPIQCLNDREIHYIMIEPN